MSAELLRRAAKEMRERAARATPGPYKPAPWHPELVLPQAWADEVGDPEDRPPFMAVHTTSSEDAAYYASWHPAVALAVADLLDRAAWQAEQPDLHDPGYVVYAVARAYLGGAP